MVYVACAYLTLYSASHLEKPILLSDSRPRGVEAPQTLLVDGDDDQIGGLPMLASERKKPGPTGKQNEFSEDAIVRGDPNDREDVDAISYRKILSVFSLTTFRLTIPPPIVSCKRGQTCF